MPAMSKLEAAFCSSKLWDLLAQKAILPWSLGGETLVEGEHGGDEGGEPGVLVQGTGPHGELINVLRSELKVTI